jgi:hypothetical protein
MLRKGFGALVIGVMIAVALLVAVLSLTLSGAQVRPPTAAPSAPRSQRGSMPTLAELATGAARGDRPPRSPWPSAADYGAIVSARLVIEQALRERDWRSKAYGALLGLKVLLTIHPMAGGRCAWLVNRTYDELRDFVDAYQGENWAPMVTVVAHDPPVTICRAPRRARPTIKLTS